MNNMQGEPVLPTYYPDCFTMKWFGYVQKKVCTTLRSQLPRFSRCIYRYLQACSEVEYMREDRLSKITCMRDIFAIVSTYYSALNA